MRDGEQTHVLPHEMLDFVLADRGLSFAVSGPSGCSVEPTPKLQITTLAAQTCTRPSRHPVVATGELMPPLWATEGPVHTAGRTVIPERILADLIGMQTGHKATEHPNHTFLHGLCKQIGESAIKFLN